MPEGRFEYLSKVADKDNKRMSEVGNKEPLFRRLYMCKPSGMKPCHLRNQESLGTKIEVHPKYLLVLT